MTQIAMVAGEPSGDLLAARVLRGIQAQLPDCRFTGIGGPELHKAGQTQWHDMDALSVFGYVDALKQLPRLLHIYQNTKKRCLRTRPDVYVGIDAPDFNLRMEKALKPAGIPTVQFVSPSIWAWRYERIHRIRESVSHMLVLFPFEVPIYEKEGIPVTFVGHPLAKEIPLEPSTLEARSQLGLCADQPVLTILPGSRASEIKWLAPLFFQVAQRLQQQHPDLQLLIPAVNPQRAQEIKATLSDYPLQHVHVISAAPKAKSTSDLDTAVSDQPLSWQCMQAADALLLASGTAALEGMMFKKPMVISYVLSPLMRKIMAWQSGQERPYTEWVGLPNILANKEIAPEFLQEDATVDNIWPAVNKALFDDSYRQWVGHESLLLHQELRQDTATLAADVIIKSI
ncbi:MAG TPA: lipid-A-disaccharide synthase [Paenalcaligenes sp.]|nr:lipid-A-disaccharide synthase [Paenalcaligenes sp.]